jgi:exopolyphosphatase/guanosine-5'-triphosphate,3'-diphosphate pyrophosphatase
VVRTKHGDPVVLRNSPLLPDGTPMPTLYWLCGASETVQVGRLEATGAINRVEAELDAHEIAASHARYAVERDALIPADHSGPKPFGGVGGTRIGVKCLHAHFGYWLAGGQDPVGQWVADKLGAQRGDYQVMQQIAHQITPALAKPVAAIDIGTNSTNLLIVSPDGDELAREVYVTRIGEGVAETKTLSDAAVTRTLARLEIYRSLIKQHGAAKIRVVATEACRLATNCDQFFGAVKDLLGVTPELLSGADEGRLAYRGALGGWAPTDEPTFVFDIGGGSTEFMVGTTVLTSVVSIPVGAVVVTENEFHRDPPRPEELTNAIGLVTDFLDDIVRDYPDLSSATRIIGVAGTIVTVAAVELGLKTFDASRLHGMTLTRSAAEDVFRTLATEPLRDRLHNPGLPPDRADIIVGGCCVLVAIMRKLRLDSITVSTRNILDGIVAELLETQAT